MKKIATIAAKISALAIALTLALSNGGVKAMAGTVGIGYYVVKDGVTVTDLTNGTTTVGVDTANFTTLVSAPAKTVQVDEDALKRAIGGKNYNERTNEKTTAYEIEVNDENINLYYNYSVEQFLSSLGLPVQFGDNTIDWYVIKRESDGYHVDGVNLSVKYPTADPVPVNNDEDEQGDEEEDEQGGQDDVISNNNNENFNDIVNEDEEIEETEDPADPDEIDETDETEVPADTEESDETDDPADTEETDETDKDDESDETEETVVTEETEEVEETQIIDEKQDENIQPDVVAPAPVIPVLPRFVIITDTDDTDDVDTTEETVPAVEEEEIVDVAETTTPEGAVEEPAAEEEEIVDVVETTTPEGAVEEPAEEEEVELDVIDTPQGDVLPQTGVLSAAVFYGIGSLCIALGGTTLVKVRRREDK